MKHTVNIIWEHGDADYQTTSKVEFKNQQEAVNFLKFIYDLRKFVPNSGWGNMGHFTDDYNTSTPEWRNEVLKKHNIAYDEAIERDGAGGGDCNYSAKIEHIWVTVNRKKHNIMWKRPFKYVNLPKPGVIFPFSTGSISGHGPSIFGGRATDYLNFDRLPAELKKFQNKGLEITDYPIITGKVLDCDIDHYGLDYNEDYYALHYTLLMETEYGKCTIQIQGYDKDFGEKFNKPKYGTKIKNFIEID